jgi:threonine aldolase
MREAMARAEVGDDAYGEDPTVNALERRVADLLGMEAAMFVPTGTMANQIALRLHTDAGDVALIDRSAHMVLNECGAAAALWGVTLRPLWGTHGIFTGADVDAAMDVSHPFNPTHLTQPVRLLCVENTHNVGGGSVWPLDAIRSVAAVGREHGLGLHLDGARLWNAALASGTPESDYTALFDTVSVCFSKGLGAPVGSALVGSSRLIARARRYKQQLGGGFRQAGIIAAGALYALENHRERLRDDHENARLFAMGISEIPGVRVELDWVRTNIIRFDLTRMDSGAFAEACHARGLFILPTTAHGVRAVMHLDVTRQDAIAAVDIVRDVVT